MLHFPLVLMNRLNKTESAVFSYCTFSLFLKDSFFKIVIRTPCRNFLDPPMIFWTPYRNFLDPPMIFWTPYRNFLDPPMIFWTPCRNFLDPPMIFWRGIEPGNNCVDLSEQQPKRLQKLQTWLNSSKSIVQNHD